MYLKDRNLGGRIFSPVKKDVLNNSHTTKKLWKSTHSFFCLFLLKIKEECNHEQYHYSLHLLFL